MRTLKSFLVKNDGLTTIEWVALCAITLIAALGISTAIMGGASSLGSSVTSQICASANNPNPDCGAE